MSLILSKHSLRSFVTEVAVEVLVAPQRDMTKIFIKVLNLDDVGDV